MPRIWLSGKTVTLVTFSSLPAAFSSDCLRKNLKRGRTAARCGNLAICHLLPFSSRKEKKGLPVASHFLSATCRRSNAVNLCRHPSVTSFNLLSSRTSCFIFSFPFYGGFFFFLPGLFVFEAARSFFTLTPPPTGTRTSLRQVGTPPPVGRRSSTEGVWKIDLSPEGAGSRDRRCE